MEEEKGQQGEIKIKEYKKYNNNKINKQNEEKKGRPVMLPGNLYE